MFFHCIFALLSGMDIKAVAFPRHCGLAAVNVNEQMSLVGYRVLENKAKPGIAR